MPTTQAGPDISETNAHGQTGAACAACSHVWSSHDQIAARFCTATVVGKYSRGCVCTSESASAAPDKAGKEGT